MTKTTMATHPATRAILRVTLATWAILPVTLATRAIPLATLDIQVYLATADILAFRPATLVVILEVIQETVCWRTAY